jgi:glutamate/aspartate transport system substrate-binding protein
MNLGNSCARSVFPGSRYGLAVIVSVALSFVAAHATADTLAAVAKRGEFRMGHREGSVPFSYVDAAGQPLGYSVDICARIYEAAKAELKRPDIKLVFVQLKPAERISALKDDKIDVECSTTTNTSERQKEIAFSYTTFVAGVKLLARVDSGVESFAQLRNQKVVVNQKTTTETVLRNLNAQRSLGFEIVPSPDTNASFKALVDGQVKAIASDDAVLVGLIAKTGKPDAYRFVGKYLSVEPYAIGMRKDDSRFLRLVDGTIAKLFASGEIYKLYDKWFNTSTIKLPMNQYMKENVRLPNKFGKVD